MSGNLANILFNNFVPILIVVLIIYIISQFKKMSDYRNELQKRFDQALTEYLNKKIKEAKDTTDSILQEYGRQDEISTEISRLLITIEKGESGDLNDKVATSNALNKFKLNKNVDLEKYPSLAKLNNLGTFNEEDMTSLDNGVALARKEYNTYAFRYNQIASGFPIQYIAKFLGFKSSYNIFGNPKSNRYEEVVEELITDDKTDINSLDSLNMVKDSIQELAEEQENNQEEVKEVEIEHTDVVLKPSTDLSNLSDKKEDS